MRWFPDSRSWQRGTDRMRRDRSEASSRPLPLPRQMNSIIVSQAAPWSVWQPGFLREVRGFAPHPHEWFACSSGHAHRPAVESSIALISWCVYIQNAGCQTSSGNPAIDVRPVTLRPRLATGLPFSANVAINF